MTIQEARASVGKPTGRRLCLPILGRALLATGLAIGLTPVLGAGTAHACSCGGRTEKQERKAADVVFKGTVTQERPHPATGYRNSLTYVFSPTRVYKGDVRWPERVRAGEDGATCSVRLRGAGPFLVFARHAEPRSDTALARKRADDKPLKFSGCFATKLIGAEENPSFGPGEPVAES